MQTMQPRSLLVVYINILFVVVAIKRISFSEAASEPAPLLYGASALMLTV